MPALTRRSFLAQSAIAAAATVTIGGTKSSGRVIGANDTIRIGVAGLNGRGGSHIDAWGKMKNVQIVALIDPDTRAFSGRIKQVTAKGVPEPQTYQDVRKALESKDLDALSIATPNHWHALMTIWACQAGKDVYVEKPCSHNISEGRIAVETARKYGRVVQHGTQNRGLNQWAKLNALTQSGKLGKLLVSRGLCYKTRNSIGTKPNAEPPKGLDFSLWEQGPAQDRPFNGNLVHYNWHWFWDFGNGDIGNQGVHQMDVARWLIPGAKLPKSVVSVGGRFGYRDQAETPNTQIAVMDFGETQLIFEVRGLKTAKYYGQDVGNILHYEAGVVAGSKFFPKGKGDGEPVPEVKDFTPVGPGGDIFGNFIHCVRNRKLEEQQADIIEGHLSSTLGHLANISYRLGTPAPFGTLADTFKGNDAALESLSRAEENLSKENALTLKDVPSRAGRFLKFDGETERFADPEANALLTREYRAPFVVPSKVV